MDKLDLFRLSCKWQRRKSILTILQVLSAFLWAILFAWLFRSHGCGINLTLQMTKGGGFKVCGERHNESFHDEMMPIFLWVYVVAYINPIQIGSLRSLIVQMMIKTHEQENNQQLAVLPFDAVSNSYFIVGDIILTVGILIQQLTLMK